MWTPGLVTLKGAPMARPVGRPQWFTRWMRFEYCVINYRRSSKKNIISKIEGIEFHTGEEKEWNSCDLLIIFKSYFNAPAEELADQTIHNLVLFIATASHKCPFITRIYKIAPESTFGLDSLLTSEAWSGCFSASAASSPSSTQVSLQTVVRSHTKRHTKISCGQLGVKPR